MDLGGDDGFAHATMLERAGLRGLVGRFSKIAVGNMKTV